MNTPPLTPIVLIHGIRLTSSMWRSHRDRLAAQRPAVAIDLPGHGTRAGERFTIEAAADAIAEAIDSLPEPAHQRRVDSSTTDHPPMPHERPTSSSTTDQPPMTHHRPTNGSTTDQFTPAVSRTPGQPQQPPPALVVGMSLGGYVGIATAARHPARVAGLMAIGCTTVPTSRLARPIRALAGFSGNRGQWLQRRALRLVLGRRVAEMACAGGLYTNAVPDALDALVAGDPLAELANFPGRVWLVNGQRDHFRAEEDRFLAACRNGCLTVVPRAGHFVSLTHEDRISTMIEAAARRLDQDEHHRTPSGG